MPGPERTRQILGMDVRFKMTGNQAVNHIFDRRTPPETRAYLRRRVYAAFDEMYEESTGKRPRRNQGVLDALQRWKEGRGGLTLGEED